MGWRDYEKEDFELEEVCEFVACVELYDHDEYKRVVVQKRTPKLNRLKQVLKGAKNKRKFREFFKKIFGRFFTSKKDKKVKK